MSGWQDDPIVVEPAVAAPKAPAWAGDPIVDQAPDASAAKGGVLGGMAMGLRDPVDAGAQMLRRVVPEWLGKPVDAFGEFLAAHGFPVTASKGVAGVDNVVRGANADYDASRALAGRDGFDVARTVGNIANPVNRIVPMSGSLGTGALAARAAGQGAVSGLVTPVTTETTGPVDFLARKAEQATLGATVGAALTPLANSVMHVGGDIGNRIGAMLRGSDGDAVEAAIAVAAKKEGIDLSHIDAADLDQVRQQVAAAMKSGKTLDPAAAIRMQEGQQVLGPDAGLTVGQATRDPAQFTLEKNVRGLPGGGDLMSRYNAQSGALTNALNQRGATAASGAYDTGGQVVNALKTFDTAAGKNVSALYDRANAMNAGEIPLDGQAFASAAMDKLHPENGIGSGRFLPAEIRDTLNDISTGKTPLNVSVAEQFRTMLASASRSATDGNVKKALGVVREALDQAPPATALGEDATNAFKAARTAHQSRMTALDENPALAAAVDPSTPTDSFFQKYVLKGNAKDLQSMVDQLTSAGAAEGPKVIDSVRKQIINHLKTASLSGAEDDVGTFSQAGYNRALRSLGDDRLSAFFTPAELADLDRVGRVAAYAQVAPAGNAVNTSNTGSSALYGVLSKIADSVPILGGLKKSAGDLATQATARNALASKVPANSVQPVSNALRPLLPAFSGAGAAAGAELVQ